MQHFYAKFHTISWYKCLLNNFVTIENIQNMNHTIAIGCDRKDEIALNYSITIFGEQSVG